MQYVLVDLPPAPKDASRPDPFAPGARLAVRIDPATGAVAVEGAADADAANAAAERPLLLQGQFEETVGSVMVVHPPSAGGGAGDGGEARRTRPRHAEEEEQQRGRAPGGTAAAAAVVATVEARVRTWGAAAGVPRRERAGG